MSTIGKQLVYLLMSSAVAVALTGAAYTLWFEKLTVQATLETGSLEAGWSGSVTCTGDATESTSLTDSQHLAITLQGTQSLIQESCIVELQNLADVPFAIEQYTFTVTGPQGELGTVACTTSQCSGTFGTVTVVFDAGLGCTVDPESTRAGTLTINADSTTEGEQYDVAVAVKLTQWNTSTWDDCGTPIS